MKRRTRKNTERIERAYNQTCYGIQINIMDMVKVAAVGERSIAEGDDDDTLRLKIRDFVETIRQN